MLSNNKDKIINDPIYGFITIDEGIIKDLIDHKCFQRLRKISQLGLSHLVYPGAHHSRFHHAIGCLHLMNKAISQLRKKGHIITDKEAEGLKIAILLHDIGHGPFSHALENTIIKELSHEEMSLIYMQDLNIQFNGKLSIAIQIFKDSYSKKFLHQLVSSQLDMDRLDYLKRDSFFSGVTEGNIGTERIINMLDVRDGKLVIEEKGIYSIEKFLFSRRLMYWQVYLHKTVVSAEQMLIKIIERVKFLLKSKNKIFVTASLEIFLKQDFNKKDFRNNSELIHLFSEIDDYDIYTCLKYWKKNEDFVLSELSKMMLNRNILKTKISKKDFSKNDKEKLINNFCKLKKCSNKEAEYFIFSNKISNSTYNIQQSNINILMKDEKILDITLASDQFDIKVLNKTVNKYFLCYPTV